jgi:HEAT repeat protein
LSEAGPLAGLIERLGSEDRAAQRVACDEAIARARAEPGVRDALLDLLREGRPRARFAAAFALFRLERPTLRVLPALLDALELPDGDLRWSAAHMLATLGRMQGEVLPVLLHEARRSPSPLRRRMALYALRELAPESAATRDTVIAALDDREGGVRRAALTCVAKLTEPETDGVERVLAILAGDEDPRMRRIAASLLPLLLALYPDRADSGRAALETAAACSDAALARAARAALARLAADPQRPV